MKFQSPIPAKKIAELCDGILKGNTELMLRGANEIHRVREGDLVFVNHPKYYAKALESAASCILIDTAEGYEIPQGKAVIITADPFRVFNAVNLLYGDAVPREASPVSERFPDCDIHPSAVIAPGVTIGKGTKIHAQVVIEANTTIGEKCVIRANTVIGSDAFYYRKLKDEEGFEPLVSVGGVMIGDRVEIGAGCTIDRGVTDYTLIDDHCILDNQIQIGHDTRIGKRCLIASQTGIAGCCDIEDDVTIWGQVGMASGVRVSSGTVLLAKCGVNRDLEKGAYFGLIAEEFKSWLKKEARLRKL